MQFGVSVLISFQITISQSNVRICLNFVLDIEPNHSLSTVTIVTHPGDWKLPLEIFPSKWNCLTADVALVSSETMYHIIMLTIYLIVKVISNELFSADASNRFSKKHSVTTTGHIEPITLFYETMNEKKL